MLDLEEDWYEADPDLCDICDRPAIAHDQSGSRRCEWCAEKAFNDGEEIVWDSDA